MSSALVGTVVFTGSTRPQRRNDLNRVPGQWEEVHGAVSVSRIRHEISVFMVDETRALKQADFDLPNLVT
jgi:hypothetical protein